jgi:hypothetical protein
MLSEVKYFAVLMKKTRNSRHETGRQAYCVPQIRMDERMTAGKQQYE